MTEESPNAGNAGLEWQAEAPLMQRDISVGGNGTFSLHSEVRKESQSRQPGSFWDLRNEPYR